MIRKLTPADTDAVKTISVASGLFAPAELPIIDELLTDYFARHQAAGHIALVIGEPDARGVAYAQPAAATQGTWYLTLIAVHGDGQGQGYGTQLLRAIEAEVVAQHGRLLLVETSGLPSFARTRAFYERCGYAAEAQIRDFYAMGEDMVLYRKTLALQS